MISMINHVLPILFAGIFLNTILGTILSVCWKAISPRMEGQGLIRLNYGILKVVLLSFLIPFGIIIYVIRYGNIFNGMEVILPSTPILSKVFIVIALIWVVGVVKSFFTYLCTFRKIRVLRREAIGAEEDYMGIVERAKDALGIKTSIGVGKSPYIDMPIICGIFRPMVLVPERLSLSMEEKEIAILHELIHMKHKDLLWKQICNVATMIHWFHPVKKWLIHAVDDWSEAYCDYTAYQTIESRKKYFQVILDIATRETEVPAYFCSALYEDKSALQRRILRAKAVKQMNAAKGILCFGVSVGIFCIGVVTVGATTLGYRTVYWEIADKTDEGTRVEGEDYLSLDDEEHTEKIKKSVAIRKLKLEKMESRMTIILPQRIKKGVYESTSIKANRGEIISLGVSYSVKDDRKIKKQDIKSGLIDERGNRRYIFTDVDTVHHYELQKSGEYKVFVENKSEYEIEVTGPVAVLQKQQLEE